MASRCAAASHRSRRSVHQQAVPAVDGRQQRCVFDEPSRTAADDPGAMAESQDPTHSASRPNPSRHSWSAHPSLPAARQSHRRLSIHCSHLKQQRADSAEKCLAIPKPAKRSPAPWQSALTGNAAHAILPMMSQGRLDGYGGRDSVRRTLGRGRPPVSGLLRRGLRGQDLSL